MMMEDLKVWGTPSDSTYFRAFRTCVCQLKGSVHGVTGGFQRCVCVQTIKHGTKDVKAVWKVGIMGVCCCCSSSVVCNVLKSLPL